MESGGDGYIDYRTLRRDRRGEAPTDNDALPLREKGGGFLSAANVRDSQNTVSEPRQSGTGGMEPDDTTYHDAPTSVFAPQRPRQAHTRSGDYEKEALSKEAAGGGGGYVDATENVFGDHHAVGGEGNIFGDQNAVRGQQQHQGQGRRGSRRWREERREAPRNEDIAADDALSIHSRPGDNYPEYVPHLSAPPTALPGHIHAHSKKNHPTYTFLIKCITEGFQIGSFIGTTVVFLQIVVMALVVHGFHLANPFWRRRKPVGAERGGEMEKRITGERFSARTEYYCKFWGYQCEVHEVETEDGFYCKMHHIISPRHNGRRGQPVLIMHGILSTCTTFVVNEERSLAFWLLEQGYDVWLGNVRGNLGMRHRSFSRRDPRYWSWGLREMAIYDVPAMVNHVYEESGRRKVAYIGHSQGTGIMFLCLSRGMRPELGRRLSCFCALGPAVYAGPCLKTFPFSLLRQFGRNRTLWGVLMGEREFIPIMSLLQQYMPSWMFGHLAFPVFAFIFGFHDHNMLPRQIPKFFRCVPVPNSSELLFYYMGHFAWNGCLFKQDDLRPWWTEDFPTLTIVYGTIDPLVVGAPLVERIRNHEPHVRLFKAVPVEDYEHMDVVWAPNVVEDCFYHVRDTIEETRDGRV